MWVREFLASTGNVEAARLLLCQRPATCNLQPPIHQPTLPAKAPPLFPSPFLQRSGALGPSLVSPFPSLRTGTQPASQPASFASAGLGSAGTAGFPPVGLQSKRRPTGKSVLSPGHSHVRRTGGPESATLSAYTGRWSDGTSQTGMLVWDCLRAQKHPHKICGGPDKDGVASGANLTRSSPPLQPWTSPAYATFFGPGKCIGHLQGR